MLPLKGQYSDVSIRNPSLTHHMSKSIRTIIVYLTIATVLTACGLPANQESAIRSVLEKQVEAWNNADLEAFMETYVKSEDLRFSSGGAVRRGWEDTKRRYYESYPSKEAMGRLEFEELAIKTLSSRWAEVHGRYRLFREGEYGNATGLFTILMENTPGGWKILHDHTSAAPTE